MDDVIPQQQPNGSGVAEVEMDSATHRLKSEPPIDHEDENKSMCILETNRGLPLITPDKRLTSSENTSHIGLIGVRKRSPLSSPTRNCDSVDARQRQVSKVLFNSTTPTPAFVLERKSPVARCIFGPPSRDANSAVLQNYENQVNREYEMFRKRYEIVDIIKDLFE